MKQIICEIKAPLPLAYANSAMSSVNGRNGGQTTTEKLNNSMQNNTHTAYMTRTRTSKQKKTNEEKQAKKKE